MARSRRLAAMRNASVGAGFPQTGISIAPGNTIFTVRRWPGGKPAACNHFPRSLTIGTVLPGKSLRAPQFSMLVCSFSHATATFCINLHRAGVPQPEVMELMRHNDPRLTATTSTDASLLSPQSAIQKLGFAASQRASQKSVAAGHLLAQPVAESLGWMVIKPLIIKGKCLCLARRVSSCRKLGGMVRAAGFEPATPTV